MILINNFKMESNRFCKECNNKILGFHNCFMEITFRLEETKTKVNIGMDLIEGELTHIE